jgi:hypothetical protein
VTLNIGGKLALELAASNFVGWIIVGIVIGHIYKPALAAAHMAASAGRSRVSRPNFILFALAPL